MLCFVKERQINYIFVDDDNDDDENVELGGSDDGVGMCFNFENQKCS